MIKLAVIVTVLASLSEDLPLGLFLIVAGLLPGLWWSSAAWEADDVDVAVCLVVAAVAVLPAALLGVAHTPHLFSAVWIGAALASVRLRPAKVKTVSPEEWARRNAHRYRPGRADRPIPDTASSDPYALLLGWWRPRHVPPAPLEVPPEHERFVGRDETA